jgi:hypothetical protein
VTEPVKVSAIMFETAFMTDFEAMSATVSTKRTLLQMGYRNCYTRWYICEGAIAVHA